MLLNAGAIAIFGPGAQPVAAKFISVSAGSAAILLAGLLAARLARNLVTAPVANVAGLLAAALVAVNPAFGVNATSGLETTLFAALLIGLALAAQAEQDAGRNRWAAPLAASLVICRPEGILFVALLGAGFLLPASRESGCLPAGSRRRVVSWVMAGVAALVAQSLFRFLVYDGQFLPNTYFAKAGGFFHLDALSSIGSAAMVAFLGLV
ncbi:MAG: hypothetical protein FD129_847, partial [bacterium]